MEGAHLIVKIILKRKGKTNLAAGYIYIDGAQTTEEVILRAQKALKEYSPDVKDFSCFEDIPFEEAEIIMAILYIDGKPVYIYGPKEISEIKSR